MNYPNLPKTLLAVSVAAVLTGCIGEDTASTSGSTGTQQDTQILRASGDRLVQKSSVQTASVAEECGTRGGQAVQSGFDWNGNNTLDADEVDKTVYICNGADGSGGGSGLSLTVLEAGSTQCQAGGILLSDGTNTYPLCNAVDVVTPTSLAQAKDLAAGLGNWVSGIDTWATQAAAGMEAQATELESLMSADQVEVSMMAMMYTLQAAADWLASNNYANGNANLEVLLAAEIVPDTPETAHWGDLIAANGIITAMNGTLTFTDISITVKMGDESVEPYPEGLQNVTASFSVDQVTVPTSSSATTASNTLALSLSNAVATSGDSSVTVPSGNITLNTTNAFRLVVPDNLEAEEKWGDFDIEMALGTDTAPITITTPGAEGKGNISFSGYLGGKVFVDSWAPAGLTNEEHQLSKIENLLAQGDLTYNNQTVKINLGLDAPKIQQIDLSYFDTELADLATGNTLNGFLSFTKEDITSGYIYGYYDSYNLHSVELYRFNLAGNSRNLAVAAHSSDGGVNIDNYQIYEVNIDPYGGFYLYDDSYYYYGNDESYMKTELLRRAGNYNLHVFGDVELNAYTTLGNQGEAKGYVTIDGKFDIPKADVFDVLDEPSGSFNLAIKELDVVNQQARFGNHSEYTLTGSMELNGLQAADGSALVNARLGYLAERSGYSNQAGGRVQLSLKHGDQEFIANYLHPRNMDIFNNSDYYYYDDNLDAELMRGTPTRFSFSDNNGGLLHSQSGDSRMYSNCSQWNSNRPEEMALGCVLGADEFGIYIDGVRHGTIYQNNFGEWIAVFADKSEQVIYNYSH